ncbi:MAG: carboxypeptidase regulatory-like domain-containing protein [Gemmatimonadales bacterium]
MIAALLLLQAAAVGRVAGTVRSEAGTPIVGATVSLGGRPEVRTDSAGRFAATEIPAGRSDLFVEALAFHPLRLKVEVPAGRTVQLDIGLTALVSDTLLPVLRIEVRDGTDRSALPMATVEVDGVARTALDGVAVFRGLEPGRHVIRAGRLGYAARDTSVRLVPVERTIVVQLDPTPAELSQLRVIASRGSRAGLLPPPGDFRDAVTTGVNRLDRAALAGVPVAFEPDVFRALQPTVGVNGSSDENAHLPIRGGGPEHTRVLLDGIPILGPYHLYGTFGAFTPEAVGEAQVLRGALPARVGEALGSVVSLQSQRAERLEMTGGVSLLAGRLAVAGPIGRTGGSWVAAGRRSLLFYGGGSRGGPIDATYPHGFWDAHLSVRLPLGSADQVTVTGFRSGDLFRESVDMLFTDGAGAPMFARSRNEAGGVAWNHAFAPTFGLETSLRYSRYAIDVAIGDTVGATSVGSPFATRNEVRVGALGAALVRHAGRGTIRGGLEFGFNRVSLLGRENGGGFVDDSLRAEIGSMAGYAEHRLDLGQFTLATGVRVVRRPELNEWSVEPRVVGRWQGSDRLAISLGISRTTQTLQSLRDDRPSVLGPPLWILPADQTRQSSSAVSLDAQADYRPDPGWQVGASLFHRRLGRVLHWWPASDRSLGAAEFDDGRVTGAEVAVGRTAGRLRGWITASVQGTTMRSGDGQSYRPRWSYSSAASGVAQLAIGSRSRLSLRGDWARGRPYWLDEGSVREYSDPSRQSSGSPPYTPVVVWSDRQGTLPAYFRIDFDATTSFSAGPVLIAPVIGLLNLSHHGNVAGFFRGDSGLDGRSQLIGPFPTVGINIRLGGNP